MSRPDSTGECEHVWNRWKLSALRVYTTGLFSRSTMFDHMAEKKHPKRLGRSCLGTLQMAHLQKAREVERAKKHGGQRLAKKNQRCYAVAVLVY